jgi:hypothetical protein
MSIRHWVKPSSRMSSTRVFYGGGQGRKVDPDQVGLGEGAVVNVREILSHAGERR